MKDTDLKLVLHVGQADRWPAVLSNLNNLTRDYPGASVRVLANGAGVYAFQAPNDLRDRIAGFAEGGVTFQVCANVLREHAVDPNTLPAYAHVVPAGVVALAAAQTERFAYVKP